jgi:hypothetical protein
MTRLTWEEERDAKILARVLLLLEANTAVLQEILKRMPGPPQYQPTTAIVVVVAPTSPVTAPLNLTAHLNRS